ncbi:MAG: hypothetical protein QXF56_01550 [Candidatus Micrarchaeia archaeon]
MLSTGAELLPFELLVMDVGTLVVGYVLFRESRKYAKNYVISQVVGTALIIAGFLIDSNYRSFSGAILVAGFLAKLGIFPFLWLHSVVLRSNLPTSLFVCANTSIVLLMSYISRSLMNQTAVVVFGLLALLFSAISAIYDKKIKSSVSSLIAAQTAYMFVSFSFLPLFSLFIAVISDFLVKFTLLASEERRDDIAQIIVALYFAEMPPFPTFAEEFEILERSFNIGIILNIAGLLMMVALLMHRVKGGKSLGARIIGAILLLLGLIVLMREI